MKNFITSIVLILVTVIFMMVLTHFKKERRLSIRQKISQTYIENDDWVQNNIHGLKFNAHGKLEKIDSIKKSIQVKKGFIYSFTGQKYSILSFYLKTNFLDYDIQKGFKGSVDSLLRSMKSTEIELNFFNNYKTKLTDIFCKGSFFAANSSLVLEGYSIWDKKSSILRSLLIVGPVSEIKIMESVIESIDFESLEKELEAYKSGDSNIKNLSREEIRKRL